MSINMWHLMEVALLHKAFSNEESGMDYPHSLKKKSIMKILCTSELVNKSVQPKKGRTSADVFETYIQNRHKKME